MYKIGMYELSNGQYLVGVMNMDKSPVEMFRIAGFNVSEQLYKELDAQVSKSDAIELLKPIMDKYRGKAEKVYGLKIGG
jgi:hypothetical protein